MVKSLLVPILLVTTIFTYTANAKTIVQACEKIEVLEVATSKIRDIASFSEIEIRDKNTVLVYMGYGTKPDLVFQYKTTVAAGTQFITDMYKSGNNILTAWYEKHYDTRLITIAVYDKNANMIRQTTFKDCKPVK